MFMLPVELNVAIVATMLAALFATMYFGSYAFAAIRSVIPLQFGSEGIYRIHVDRYAFEPSVPYSAQRAYVLSQTLGLVAFIGVLLLTAQSKRMDATILVAIFAALICFSAWSSYRRFRIAQARRH